MHVNLETLATALYVKIDDELKARPGLRPARPAAGFAPALSDAELITMAVMQSLLNIRSERRWVRYMAKNLRALFPVQLSQPGYNKRLRAALPLIQHFIRALAFDTGRGIAPAISACTVRLILAADALKPCQYQSWIFIRDELRRKGQPCAGPVRPYLRRHPPRRR